jgi:hypothetical protein
MWVHDDAFFNAQPGVLPFSVLAGAYNSFSGGYTPYTTGTVDQYGNAFISFAAPISSAYMRGGYDAGFSLLSLVGEDSDYGPGTIVQGKTVPDGGSTVTFLAAGLLALTVMAGLARTRKPEACPVRRPE